MYSLPLTSFAAACAGREAATTAADSPSSSAHQRAPPPLFLAALPPPQSRHRLRYARLSVTAGNVFDRLLQFSRTGETYSQARAAESKTCLFFGDAITRAQFVAAALREYGSEVVALLEEAGLGARVAELGPDGWPAAGATIPDSVLCGIADINVRIEGDDSLDAAPFAAFLAGFVTHWDMFQILSRQDRSTFLQSFGLLASPQLSKQELQAQYRAYIYLEAAAKQELMDYGFHWHLPSLRLVMSDEDAQFIEMHRGASRELTLADAAIAYDRYEAGRTRFDDRGQALRETVPVDLLHCLRQRLDVKVMRDGRRQFVQSRLRQCVVQFSRDVSHCLETGRLVDALTSVLVHQCRWSMLGSAAQAEDPRGRDATDLEEAMAGAQLSDRDALPGCLPGEVSLP